MTSNIIYTTFWTKFIIDELSILCTQDISLDEISSKLNISSSAIKRKIKSLNIQRPLSRTKPKARKREENIINLRIDNIKESISQYKTKQEFKLKAPLEYSFCLRHGILDKMCSNMTVGTNFNFPQTMLFEILKEIYIGEHILYNDRKTIYPRELDIFIPSLMIGFEYDGNHFHSDIERDNFKDCICKEHGITLFRIKETNKTKPFESIINQLEKFGIICDKIDERSILNKIHLHHISVDDIHNTAKQYTSKKQFKLNHPKLHSYIFKYKLFYMFDHMSDYRKSYTENECLKALSKFDTKREFRETYHGMFLQIFRKHKKAKEYYNNLIDGNKIRQSNCSSSSAKINALTNPDLTISLG